MSLDVLDNDAAPPLGKLICFETPIRSDTTPALSFKVYQHLKEAFAHKFPRIEIVTLPMRDVPSAKDIEQMNNMNADSIGAMGENYAIEKEAYLSLNREQSAELILKKMKDGITVILVGGYYIDGVINTELVERINDVSITDVIRRECGLLRPDVTFLLDALNLPMSPSEKGRFTHSRKAMYSSLADHDLPSDVVPLNWNQTITNLTHQCVDVILSRCRRNRNTERYITGQVLRRIFGVAEPPHPLLSQNKCLIGYFPHNGSHIRQSTRRFCGFQGLPTNRRLRAHLQTAQKVRVETTRVIKSFVAQLGELTSEGSGFEAAGTFLKSNTMSDCLSEFQRRVDRVEEINSYIHDAFM